MPLKRRESHPSPRGLGDVPSLRLAKQQCADHSADAPQEGGDETSVGAIRSLQIGDQKLFEKLVALDDEEHVM